MSSQHEILEDIARRSGGSANYGLGGQAVAGFIRDNGASADLLAHLLATALNDLAWAKRTAVAQPLAEKR